MEYIGTSAGDQALNLGKKLIQDKHLAVRVGTIDNDLYAYISKHGAAKIIAHLTKVFELDTPEVIEGTKEALDSLSIRDGE